MRIRKRGPTFAFLLPDGRWVIAHWLHRHPPFGWLVGLGLLAIAIALGAYPVVRRLTRRLERLQTRVDALGAGDLPMRVEVEGKDEVANLARSFNQAADRIERMVNAQRTMLSWEPRTNFAPSWHAYAWRLSFCPMKNGQSYKPRLHKILPS